MVKYQSPLGNDFFNRKVSQRKKGAEEGVVRIDLKAFPFFNPFQEPKEKSQGFFTSNHRLVRCLYVSVSVSNNRNWKF